MNYEKNLNEAILRLQESLNQIVTNTYLLGVNDGYKMGAKGNQEDGEKADGDSINKSIGKTDSPPSIVLMEAEKILREYL